MAKISVIITAYNIEKYIGQCLESVINQSLQDIEIICVNDGSRDETLNIINEYADKDSRIVVISHENMGVSSTRNVALKAVTGEYLLFLDGDDYLDDNILQKAYNRVNRDDLDFLMGCADTFADGEYSNEEKVEKFMSMYKITGEYGEKVYSGPEAMCLLRKNSDYYVSSCVKLMRTKFIKDNDLYFVDKMIHEDELYSLKVFLLANRVGITKDIFFKRRMRIDSIMTKVTKKENTLGYLITLVEGISFILSNDCQEYYQSEVASILKGIVAAVVRTYLELSQEEKEEFYKAMTPKQKFFFEVIVNKQQEQTAHVIKLKDNAQKASYVKASLENMLEKSKKDNEKADEKLTKLQTKVDKLKKDKEKLKEDKITLNKKLTKLKDDKVKLKEKNKADIDKLMGSADYRIGSFILIVPRKIKKVFKKK